MQLSVILPNYNDAGTVERAVRAICDQTRPPDEIIIIDDGSTDSSPEIPLDLSKEYPFIQLHLFDHNKGTKAAVAFGRQRATGNFIYFAASDDYILPELFETSVDLLQSNSDAAFSTSETFVENETPRGWSKSIFGTPKIRSEAGYIAPSEPPASGPEMKSSSRRRL